jgi:hypothetical protein
VGLRQFCHRREDFNSPRLLHRGRYPQPFPAVTRAIRGHDRFFKNAYKGIVHLSITLTPGFTLPHFVEVVDGNMEPSLLAFLSIRMIIAAAVPAVATLAMSGSSARRVLVQQGLTLPSGVPSRSLLLFFLNHLRKWREM